jgi:hypothetical protein
MAFVGTGAALDAAIEKHPQTPRVIDQLAHFIDRNLLPVIDQFAGKAYFHGLLCAMTPISIGGISG